MRKNIIRAMMPIAALVLVAACSDSTGPGAPELAEVRQDPVEQDGPRGGAEPEEDGAPPRSAARRRNLSFLG